MHNDVIYRCTAYHKSSEDTEPGVHGDGFWEHVEDRHDSQQ